MRRTFSVTLFVIAQPRANNDLRGFKAMRMDSKAEKPCLFPVLSRFARKQGQGVR